MNQRTVIIKNDELGLVQFTSISEAIKRHNPSKPYLARLAKIASVFDHRTNIALQAADKPTHWEKQPVLLRLEGFKKPDFFIQAASALLEEVIQEDNVKAVEAAKKRIKASQRYWR